MPASCFEIHLSERVALFLRHLWNNKTKGTVFGRVNAVCRGLRGADEYRMDPPLYERGIGHTRAFRLSRHSLVRSCSLVTITRMTMVRLQAGRGVGLRPDNADALDMNGKKITPTLGRILARSMPEHGLIVRWPMSDPSLHHTCHK